ncbi:MAG: hypothetical protein M1835_002137 [Candelina submexicana]|nr:MAG: hypothetical protein M1835_002137 [Candelina submexicana]
MIEEKPRFYVHECIQNFADQIVDLYGNSGEQAMLFPSAAVATRCRDFITNNNPLTEPKQVRIVNLVPKPENAANDSARRVSAKISAVIFPTGCYRAAKSFWQHSGDGVSSRRAEFCQKAFSSGALVESTGPRHYSKPNQRLCKGPRRYQRGSSVDLAVTPTWTPMNEKGDTPEATIHINGDTRESTQFVEERFGRNLDVSFVANAKLAIRRRIAGSLTVDADPEQALDVLGNAERIRCVEGFSESDVFLYPSGMSAIFNTHRVLSIVRGAMRSICYGFPYIDTLKILQKWGPGCLFYGNGSLTDLDNLEQRLQKGERYLALFCEFPGNPLLKSPNLVRIRSLADIYGFAVVIDETVGNFMNVHVLPFADVVVSSLTKVFSGDSNVMGGSAILNPQSQYYNLLKETLLTEYDDNYWAEDAIFMERNSRDFVSRIERINANAEAICEVLKNHRHVKEVYYPKYSPTRPFYDRCRNSKGGYGGLLSVTFYTTAEAVTFFDVLDTAKGPSLGTNFTLSSPYTLLAHYGELEWAAEFGVEADLVRISVGLEDPKDLTAKFERALEIVSAIARA